MLPAVGSDRGWMMFSPQNEPYQSLFGTGPRPPLLQGLGPVVFSASEWDWCVHTFPNELHRGGKRSNSTELNKDGEKTPLHKVRNAASGLEINFTVLQLHVENNNTANNIQELGCFKRRQAFLHSHFRAVLLFGCCCKDHFLSIYIQLLQLPTTHGCNHSLSP